MNFLRKLFGKKSAATAAATLATAATAATTVTAGSTVTRADSEPATSPALPGATDPSKDPNMIRVFDAYGREMFITKDQWRDSVLVGHLQKVWNQPDELYSVIVQSLNDGFLADMIKPAEQFAKISPDPERGAVLLGVVYLQNKRLDDAERVLTAHLRAHGEASYVLSNLAKVHSARGDSELALKTLWRSLELDPNQENAFSWYTALFSEKGGPPAGLEAIRRVAALPGSWRARLWVAHDALDRRSLDEALALFREALTLAGKPVPTDLLMQISGDLGNHGHLPEILDLVAPHFEVAVHGITVGNNLLKANLDLGRLDATRALLDQLYAQKRPDWKETLAFWDTELAKAHVGSVPADPAAKPSISMLVGDGPVWLPESSPAAELFPAPTGALVRVAFLGSTAEVPKPGDKPVHQMSDTPGRLSRALPVFLAEQVRFHGRAQVRPILPWLLGNAPAFVLGCVPWPDAGAAQYARNGDTPADYVVVTHLKSAAEPWSVELRLVRTIDAKLLGTLDASFPVAQPEAALRRLATDLLALLAREAELERTPAPAFYRVPAGVNFPQYLLRLEQLLAVRCSTMDGVPNSFLSGEREIVDGNLQLCLAEPDNAVPRLLLAHTLQRLQKIRPSVVAEFREKVQLLQKDHPLPQPAQGVLARLFAEVYP